MTKRQQVTRYYWALLTCDTLQLDPAKREMLGSVDAFNV